MVYIIRAGDRLKIGYTRRLGQRLLELQAANGTRLELLVAFPGGLDVERAVHLRFAPLAVHGEWFEGTPELVAWAIEQRRRPGALQ